LEHRLLVGQIDTQHTSVEVDAVEVLNSILCTLLVGELAEAKSFRAVGLAVVHDADVGHGACSAEEVAQVVLSGVVRNVSNIDGASRRHFA